MWSFSLLAHHLPSLRYGHSVRRRQVSREGWGVVIQSVGRTAAKSEVWSVYWQISCPVWSVISQSVGRSATQSEVWSVSLLADQLPSLKCDQSVCWQNSCPVWSVISQSVGRSAAQSEVCPLSLLPDQLPNLRCGQSVVWRFSCPVWSVIGHFVGRSAATTKVWSVSLSADKLPSLNCGLGLSRLLYIQHIPPECLHHHRHLASNTIKLKLTNIFWTTEHLFQNHYWLATGTSVTRSSGPYNGLACVHPRHLLIQLVPIQSKI
jgi:hypothetical protein